MSKRATLQEILAAYAKLRRVYAQVGERAGLPATKVLNDLAREIVAIVGAGTTPNGIAVATEVSMLQLIASMDRALASAKRDYGAVYQQVFKDSLDTTLVATPRAFMVFGESTVGRLEAARSAFITEARGSIFNVGYTQWVESFQNAGSGLKASMQRSLAQAQLNGWSQRQLAQAFLSTPEFAFSNLPSVGAHEERVFSLGGRLTPSEALVRRAHTIARTESTAATNRMHQTWTQEAGFDKYENVNGDPVAEECIAANDMPPMTLDQWDEWGVDNGWVGRPPRHPNCDSVLVAVPGDYEDVLREALAEETTSP